MPNRIDDSFAVTSASGRMKKAFGSRDRRAAAASSARETAGLELGCPISVTA